MRFASRLLGAISMQVRFTKAWACGVCFIAASLAASTATAQSDAPTRSAQSSRIQQRLDARIVSMPQVERKLELVLNRSQLVKTRSRVTRMAIADPTVIDIAPFEEDEFAIIGTAIGSTTLTLWFENDDNPLIYEVTVIDDPNVEEQLRIDYGKLERKIAILFPNSKVYLIPLHEKLVVKGQAKDAAEAARILQIVRGEFLDDYGGLYGPNGGAGRGGGGGGGYDDDGIRDEDDLYSSFIVNMLQVPGEYQVMLHVTIAELNRSQLRRMGVDFAVLFANGQHFIGSTISGGVPTLTGIFNNGDISVLINALASNGTAKILSRPSLTTLSGHPAQFLAGGEFAVPTTVGVGGVQGTSTQFRGFGTSMVVVPTVVDGDLFRLRIAPEFSQINQNNSVGGIPGLDSRRVQTTVELREGQTIVLGGLLSRQTATEVTRIPLLGEIPLIGPLMFNTKRATEDEMELLVLVTPEIVRAMDPDEVPPMPGYYVTHPNDRELYRYAMTEGAPDLEVYQLAPYGNKVGYPNPVGFNVYNPSPATPQYGPIPQANQPNGYPTPSPWTEQNSRYGDPAAGQQSQQMMQGEGYPQGMDPSYNDQMMMQYPMQMPPGTQMPQDMELRPSPSLQPYSQPTPAAPPQGGGYQQAPPAMQGYPPAAPPSYRPSGDPSARSYRGGSPTAYNSNSQQPQVGRNYSQELFNQPPGRVVPASNQTAYPANSGQPMSTPSQYGQPQSGQKYRPAGYSR